MFVLILVSVMATTVLANNGNGPNNRPHNDTIVLTAGNGTQITVRIEHRANLGQFFIVNLGYNAPVEFLTDFGTFTDVVELNGYVISLRVHGNSLPSGEVLAYPPLDGGGDDGRPFSVELCYYYYYYYY